MRPYYHIPPHCGTCICVRNRGIGACTNVESKVYFYFEKIGLFRIQVHAPQCGGIRYLLIHNS